MLCSVRDSIVQSCALNTMIAHVKIWVCKPCSDGRSTSVATMSGLGFPLPGSTGISESAETTLNKVLGEPREAVLVAGHTWPGKIKF